MSEWTKGFLFDVSRANPKLIHRAPVPSLKFLFESLMPGYVRSGNKQMNVMGSLVGDDAF